MTKILSITAFTLGAVIVVWMGASFMGSNLLAFAITCVIGVVYIIGFREVMRFQRDTGTLDTALLTTENKITDLNEWLGLLSPTLRSSVRLRIQGEHLSLPAPMLTPYLVGLLVMLGLLGTFVGMVETLKGAVSALEGSTELEAIRAGLTAPIKGLSLAFGTSVAGVSASAMLGFISALGRRQRSLASQLLDGKMMSLFQDFSLAYNRDQTFQAMQSQAQSLPLLVQTLTTVAERLDSFSNDISQQLIANQAQFHSELSTTYTTLATSVDNSLKQSVIDSSRLLGESQQRSIAELNPVIVDMVNAISQELASTHTRLADNLEQRFGTLALQIAGTTKDAAQAWQRGVSDYQRSSDSMVERVAGTLDSLNDRFSSSTSVMLSRFGEASEQWVAHQQAQDQQRFTQWHDAFTQTTVDVQQSMSELSASNQANSQGMLEAVGRLLSSTEQLVQGRIDNEDRWLGNYEARMTELRSQLVEQLSALRDEEARRGDAAVEQLKTLSTDVAEHLQNLGNGLEVPMTRLIETASETPRAAAEVISQLRAEMSNTMERDNQLLIEREQIFERLTTVTTALQQSSAEQNETLQTLLTTSADTLKEIGARFGEQVDTETTRLADTVDHFSGSAVELASLGDSFGTAVEHFSQSNRDVSEMLTQIEGALQTSTQRSDEQMAYYVVQAREIIDHTILSQQEVIEQLRQLGRATPTVGGLVI
jgi:hypothetical protein